MGRRGHGGRPRPTMGWPGIVTSALLHSPQAGSRRGRGTHEQDRASWQRPQAGFRIRYMGQP